MRIRELPVPLDELHPHHQKPTRDVAPDLSAVKGIGNKLRVLLGREARYPEQTLNEISGGAGLKTPLNMWQDVYEKFRLAGLSPHEAQSETNLRLWFSGDR